MELCNFVHTGTAKCRPSSLLQLPSFSYVFMTFYNLFLLLLPGILEEAEFYNITELIRLVKERISQRDNRPPKAGKKHMYRVLQCHENEVAQLVSTMSDGWKFEQVSYSAFYSYRCNLS